MSLVESAGEGRVEEGRGKEPDHTIIRPRESLILYSTFNTLCVIYSSRVEIMPRKCMGQCRIVQSMQNSVGQGRLVQNSEGQYDYAIQCSTRRNCRTVQDSAGQCRPVQNSEGQYRTCSTVQDKTGTAGQCRFGSENAGQCMARQESVM